MTGRGLAIAFLATILALWPIVACTPGAGTGSTEPVAIRATFEKAVPTFEPVKLTVSITGDASRLEAPAQVHASVALPPSMVLINGLLRWDGTLAPGETKSFQSTVAMVLEGDSIAFLKASYSFKDSLGNQRSGGVDEAATIRATASGGELEPVPKPQVIRSYRPLDIGAFEDDALLNNAESQRLIVFPNRNRGRAYPQLVETGLAPAKPEDVPGREESRTYGRIVGQFFKDSPAAVVALFDRRRPTTGFHLSLITWYSGGEALQITGRADIEANVYVVDYVATAPLPGWPVETRVVSPYAIFPLGWAPGEQSKEIYFRINGEIVGKQDIDLDPERETQVEIPVQFTARAAR